MPPMSGMVTASYFSLWTLIQHSMSNNPCQGCVRLSTIVVSQGLDSSLENNGMQASMIHVALYGTIDQGSGKSSRESKGHCLIPRQAYWRRLDTLLSCRSSNKSLCLVGFSTITRATIFLSMFTREPEPTALVQNLQTSIDWHSPNPKSCR
jgi:hypothetical protein